MHRFLAVLLIFVPFPFASAGDAKKAARGKEALETRAFTPSHWTADAYKEVWKFWVPKLESPPADYDRAFAEYYGLHPATYKNGGYPMGLRRGSDGKGLTNDCMACHGGSIFGKSYVGLGNSSLDLQSLDDDMNRASKQPLASMYKLSNVRGTNEAFAMTEFLLSFRKPDLSVRKQPEPWKLNDHLCEDVPAWWHLKKKKTMYHSGSHHAKSVRSIMQFMLDPRNSLEAIQKEEKVFEDIQAYLFSLEAPKYPFLPRNVKLVEHGLKVFTKHCESCHGTYGADATYPSKFVPLKTIGTDPSRALGFSQKYVDFYNKTWFAQSKGKQFEATRPQGYQAPPLDGVWATAPYFHNGSVPTLYHVLNSKARPKIFKRSFATDETAYDWKNVGWIVEPMEKVPEGLSGHERRKIYDTTQPGRGNGGHTFGDKLTDADRRAVIEYLKTL